MSGRGPGAGLDLTDPGTVRAVARRVGLSLDRRLGQHFLINREAVEQLVTALDPGPGETVFEIGPGVGTLTSALAARAAAVVAVEIDPRCVAACRITLRGCRNVTVVLGDALAVGPAEAGVSGRWLAAGNLPYQLTGALIQRLLECEAPPQRAVVLVQREVAARLAAAPGDWSLATVAVRSVALAERLGDLPPEAFEPPPAVHSSILRLIPTRAVDPALRPLVLRLAKAAFQLRRKTLRHGITRALGGAEPAAMALLGACGIDPSRRPGTLALEEWEALARGATAYSAR